MSKENSFLTGVNYYGCSRFINTYALHGHRKNAEFAIFIKRKKNNNLRVTRSSMSSCCYFVDIRIQIVRNFIPCYNKQCFYRFRYSVDFHDEFSLP